MRVPFRVDLSAEGPSSSVQALCVIFSGGGILEGKVE